MMKPTSYMENFYIEKLREQERPKPIAWDLVFLWLFALILVGCFTWASAEPDDFTDTGVGCVDDCLEPADEPKKEAITWHA